MPLAYCLIFLNCTSKPSTPSWDCQRNDLAEPIVILIATGLRISELLGLRWRDFDDQAAMLTGTGKLLRAAGKGWCEWM